jgi:hypothetical protein
MLSEPGIGTLAAGQNPRNGDRALAAPGPSRRDDGARHPAIRHHSDHLDNEDR